MQKHRIFTSTALAASLLSAAWTASAAEITLGSVTALQQTNPLAKSFVLNFVGAVNKAGKGSVRIKYIGGQEVVPPRKAHTALKRGQFDVLCAPTAYYIGTVPEGYAFYGANQGPRALRANGAWDILKEVYLKKAGAILVAWGENMTSYHTYLNVEPKFRPDGVPDLTGLKMRATGTYRPLFRALGASTINIKTSEIFTAMQRGTVQGFGFTDISVITNGYHNVIKYRITPNYYQTNQVVTMNPESWKKIGRAGRALIDKVAIEYETTSVKYIEAQRQAEEKELKKTGVKDIALRGKAAEKYLSIAYNEAWKQLKERSDYHDRLRPLMYIPGKPNRQLNIDRGLR